MCSSSSTFNGSSSEKTEKSVPDLDSMTWSKKIKIQKEFAYNGRCSLAQIKKQTNVFDAVSNRACFFTHTSLLIIKKLIKNHGRTHDHKVLEWKKVMDAKQCESGSSQARREWQWSTNPPICVHIQALTLKTTDWPKSTFILLCVFCWS